MQISEIWNCIRSESAEHIEAITSSWPADAEALFSAFLYGLKTNGVSNSDSARWAFLIFSALASNGGGRQWYFSRKAKALRFYEKTSEEKSERGSTAHGWSQDQTLLMNAMLFVFDFLSVTKLKREELSKALMLLSCEYADGRTIYLPTLKSLLAPLRDRLIFEASREKPVRDLVGIFDLSEQQVYRVIARYKRERKVP